MSKVASRSGFGLLDLNAFLRCESPAIRSFLIKNQLLVLLLLYQSFIYSNNKPDGNRKYVFRLTVVPAANYNISILCVCVLDFVDPSLSYVLYV